MWPKTTWLSRITAIAVLALVTLAPASISAEIHIISEATGPETAVLAQTLRDALSNTSPRVAALDARVTIGASAFLEALAQNDKRPLVATYLTSIEFQAALDARERPAHVTAVFSDPDPVDQVALARALLGQATLGVFDTRAAHSLVRRITDLGVRAISVSADQGINSLLRTANSFDAIIVLPDAVLNRSNINHVVRTLYRRRQVLIGHSATLTHVGALASVYPTREAIARSVVSVLERYATTGTLPGPLFVREIDVAINERLARSLNIVLPDRAEILRAVRSRAAEAAP